MTTTQQAEFDPRQPLSHKSKAVPDTSRPTPVLMHEPPPNRAMPSPTATSYRFPPPETSPPRPTFSAPPHPSGKSSAQAPFAAVPPNKSPGACTLGPPDSNMRHEPLVRNVPPSACHSHASPALDNAPQQWQRTPSTANRTYATLDTSPRLHEEGYESAMSLKLLAFPLAIPGTVHIGDVGVYLPNGAFHKHFNVCDPSDLPPYFIPLHAPIRQDDLCQYLTVEHHSFVTSPSIERLEDYAGTIGAEFRSSASEGTILAAPHGVIRTELKEISKFRDFIAMNVDNWARYIDESNLRPGEELRLITGHLTAAIWGIATFRHNTDKNLRITFLQTAEQDKRYAWNAPPQVKTSLSGRIRFSRPEDAVAVTAFTITPRSRLPGGSKLLGEDVVEPIGVRRHPCDFINESLLAKTQVKVAVSHERDWCAVLEQSDLQFPDETELLKRVFSLNELCLDEGNIAFLRWKPRRTEVKSAADILKQIDVLRDTLDDIGDSDLLKRADVLHEITDNILTYLRVSKNKDPRDSSFLLSIAKSNVEEEVRIMAELKQPRASTLHLYASTRLAQWHASGESKLLEQAIVHWRKALEIEPAHPEATTELATALWDRFTRYRQPHDLNEVIILYRALLFSQIPNNPAYVSWLNGIGLALWERYKRTKSSNDMDHAISYFRQASLSYPTPCDPFTLSNLGNILITKARTIKDTTESDEAISCYRRALDSVNPLHPNRAAFLCNLGDALCYRYDRRCIIADLNEALRCYERALELPSPHHRDRVSLLYLFADKLQLRYAATRDVQDLEEVVKRLSEAKRLASPSHPKYAGVAETLVFAQRELGALDGRAPPHHGAADFPSPPPSSAASPALEHAQVPTLRPTTQWGASPTGSAGSAGGSGVYRASPKTFRIVSRSHTMKPYSRPGRDSSASDSESSGSRSRSAFLPHPHAHAPGPSGMGHANGHGAASSMGVGRAKSPPYHRVGQQNPRRHHTMPGLP